VLLQRAKSYESWVHPVKTPGKLVANYKFIACDVINGFDFGLTAVLKPMTDKEDLAIVPMEWGFIPRFPESVNKINSG
jgi:hypothetical protein